MTLDRLKLPVALFFGIVWVLLPSQAFAVVLQGVHDHYDTTISAGTQQGQAFTGISNLESVSVYAKRYKLGQFDYNEKAINVYNIQCFEDPGLQNLCPDNTLDPNGYVKFTRGSCVDFVNTSVQIPMVGCGGDLVREIFDTGFIDVPYGTEQKIKLILTSETDHVFNPEWYYYFNFVPVAYPNVQFADRFNLGGTTQNLYAPTDFFRLDLATTTMRDMYFEINEAGTTTPGVEPGATTPQPKNIEILNPTYGTTTATTTFSIQIKYKTAFSLDFRPSTTRHFRILDAITGEIEQEYNVPLQPNSGENVTITATGTVPAGSKYIRAMYLDVNGNPYSEIDEVFFNVATNTYFQTTGKLSPLDGVSGFSQIDCSTFDIGCQFQKALTFLFTPSSNTLDRFRNLWQNISEKKPFGYVTVTINQLKSLDTGGSQAFSFGSIPFVDELFTPFRSLFAGILWALFAIYFFMHRLRHLDI
jgi:hypothetical protein